MASGRTLLTPLALACAAVLALSCAARRDAPARAVALPTTRVRALDSTETELAAALRGRPALVTLWATWCDACRDEMPALNRIDEWAKGRGSLVVGVAIGESLSRISSFASESHVAYLVLVDEEFHFADAIGEKRVPATLVVDRSGRIVYTGGAVDDRSLAVFRKLVDGDPAELAIDAGGTRGAPARLSR